MIAACSAWLIAARIDDICMFYPLKTHKKRTKKFLVRSFALILCAAVWG